MTQLWLPSLCPACKPLFIRSAARSTDKALPVKEFCKDCRAFLASKQQQQQPSKTSVSVPAPVKKEPVTATTVLKDKVISEIESLIKAPLVEVTPVKGPPVPRYFLAKPAGEPVPAPQLPLSPSSPIYTAFSAAGIDWCRYCGTTAGTSWRPGPWGPRSLCFRHGREYAFHKRLDLSAFEGAHGSAADRAFPVLQGYCKLCWRDDGIVRKCHGCANGFHAQCYLKRTSKSVACLLAKPWYCNATCAKHFESGSIRVAHSTKEALPFQLGHVPGEPAEGGHPEHAGEECDDNDSFSEAASEHLDVVTDDSGFKPSFFIRLREPVRPPTPHPPVAEAAPLLPKKRRVSCPAAPTSAGSARPVAKPKRPRASSASVPDFLITVDHSVAIRRDERPRTPVLCPAYRVIQRPSSPMRPASAAEPVSEEVYSQRHSRYEELEKTTRLLKPDILSTLFRRDSASTAAVA
jgi:hypothetical protein